VLRTGREKPAAFSVQGFVEDFVRFIDSSEAQSHQNSKNDDDARVAVRSRSG